MTTTSEIKISTENIVGYLGSKELAIYWLELQKQERMNEIMIIELMIANITGVH